MTCYSSFKDLTIDMQNLIKEIQSNAFIDNFRSPEELRMWLEAMETRAKVLASEYHKLIVRYCIIHEEL